MQNIDFNELLDDLLEEAPANASFHDLLNALPVEIQAILPLILPPASFTAQALAHDWSLDPLDLFPEEPPADDGPLDLSNTLPDEPPAENALFDLLEAHIDEMTARLTEQQLVHTPEPNLISQEPATEPSSTPAAEKNSPTEVKLPVIPAGILDIHNKSPSARRRKNLATIEKLKAEVLQLIHKNLGESAAAFQVCFTLTSKTIARSTNCAPLAPWRGIRDKHWLLPALQRDAHKAALDLQFCFACGTLVPVPRMSPSIRDVCHACAEKKYHPCMGESDQERMLGPGPFSAEERNWHPQLPRRLAQP